MLVIHPDECIDCSVCEPECPIDAIHKDTDPNLAKWLEINQVYSKIWPKITSKKDPPEDEEKWRSINNKFENFFSANPGNADKH